MKHVIRIWADEADVFPSDEEIVEVEDFTHRSDEEARAHYEAHGLAVDEVIRMSMGEEP